MTEESIFIGALEKKDAAERAAFLDRACAGDESLRQRIERLLRRHEQTDSLLDAPAAGVGATVNQPAAERPGVPIGPYQLLQPIGEGGMGTVYMAEQTRPVKRLVALKLIKPGMDSRQVLARFEAERQALALMDHPNIAKVLEESIEFIPALRAVSVSTGLGESVLGDPLCLAPQGPGGVDRVHSGAPGCVRFNRSGRVRIRGPALSGAWEVATPPRATGSVGMSRERGEGAPPTPIRSVTRCLEERRHPWTALICRRSVLALRPAGGCRTARAEPPPQPARQDRRHRPNPGDGRIAPLSGVFLDIPIGR
jgi:hypothetical protein